MNMKLLFFIFLSLLSATVYAEIFKYDTKFEGLQVGASTLDNAIKRFGEPITEEEFSTNVRYSYSYSRFAISIQNSTGKINSIMIYDPSYTDSNGISVGHSVKMVEKQFSVEITDAYFVDGNKGIIYWFLNGYVSKIVLASVLNL